VTEKFPVLSAGSTPRVDMKEWRFQLFGQVEQELEWTWEEFLGLGRVALTADFHCVTQWSRFDNAWEGVPFSAVLQRARPLPLARHVMVHCHGGYTTNLALGVLQRDDVLFAFRHDGQPLAPDHGGPLRLVVPKRYAWKSAKWVTGLEFMEGDRPGYWEARGYHMEGDPWKEERLSSYEG
jgi:DMSO/TMAO reductase YedYZ molybdopterin-dependent catalytic subunit